mmetsp:Transcript_22152/g.75982  ORF Transcript_22152/g.75982 Transcript_22152/m.75982 type:complete len:241 (+) Transcript_22152:2798-3520(+)
MRRATSVHRALASERYSTSTEGPKTWSARANFHLSLASRYRSLRSLAHSTPKRLRSAEAQSANAQAVVFTTSASSGSSKRPPASASRPGSKPAPSSRAVARRRAAWSSVFASMPARPKAVPTHPGPESSSLARGSRARCRLAGGSCSAASDAPRLPSASSLGRAPSSLGDPAPDDSFAPRGRGATGTPRPFAGAVAAWYRTSQKNGQTLTKAAAASKVTAWGRRGSAIGDVGRFVPSNGL